MCKSSSARVAVAVLMVLGLILVPFFLWEDAFDRIAAGLGASDKRYIAASGAGLLALDIILPVPSSVVATAMGVLLGGLVGTMVNATGLTAGCVFGFFLGRSSSPAAIRILGQRNFDRFYAWVQRNGVPAMMICRAVPVIAEASVLALGAGKGRPGPLILAAALADVMLGAAFAFAGAARGPDAASSAPAYVAAIGLPVVASIAVLIWIRRR